MPVFLMDPPPPFFPMAGQSFFLPTRHQANLEKALVSWTLLLSGRAGVGATVWASQPNLVSMTFPALHGRSGVLSPKSLFTVNAVLFPPA